MTKRVELVSDTGYVAMDIHGVIATGSKSYSILNIYGSMGNTPAHAIINFKGDRAIEIQRGLQYYDGPAISQIIELNQLKCLFCDANWEVNGVAK